MPKYIVGGDIRVAVNWTVSADTEMEAFQKVASGKFDDEALCEDSFEERVDLKSLHVIRIEDEDKPEEPVPNLQAIKSQSDSLFEEE